MRIRLWRLRGTHVRGVRILALDHSGRVLLVRHSYGTRGWMPPGGGLEPGEAPVDTATRELLEETGCRLLEARIVQTSEETLQGVPNTVSIIVGKAEGQIRIDRREIVDAGFFASDALPDEVTPAFRGRLQEWLAAAKDA